jgi:hypothetical protein
MKFAGNEKARPLPLCVAIFTEAWALLVSGLTIATEMLVIGLRERGHHVDWRAARRAWGSSISEVNPLTLRGEALAAGAAVADLASRPDQRRQMAAEARARTWERETNNTASIADRSLALY